MLIARPLPCVSLLPGPASETRYEHKAGFLEEVVPACGLVAMDGTVEPDGQEREQPGPATGVRNWGRGRQLFAHTTCMLVI